MAGETTVNQRIDYFLKSKDISQSEIAIKLSITKQTVNNWVSGNVQIPIKHIVSLLTEFETLNARWLLTGKGTMDDFEDQKPDKSNVSLKKDGIIELLTSQLADKDSKILSLQKEIGKLEERLESRKK